MTTLFIVRHGNTFDPGDTIVRVGLKTDMELSQSGIYQAELIGRFIKHERIHISAVYTSKLRRTIETANVALEEAGASSISTVEHLDIFNEIDYGPDEGKSEEEVIARVGEQAIHDWNTMAVVPPGWILDPEKIVTNWQTFANDILTKYSNEKTVMIVTSNGIARFAPYLTHSFLEFSKKHNIKMDTGHVSALTYRSGNWVVDYWNEKPG